ncbi:MAG: 4-hydroxy-tetrahydrodipicolinate reductase [Pseudomonadota bacterium]
MTRIGIAGAGRMGLAIAGIVAADDSLTLGGVWSRRPDETSDTLQKAGVFVGDDLARIVADSDVLIDFSLPAGTTAVCECLTARPTPLVCGVSGLTATHLAAVQALGESMPVVYDRNMSVGIAVLTRYVAETAMALGPEFQVSVDEVHHVHKIDAPSGTALKLGEAIADARGQDFASVRVTDGHRKSQSDILFGVERRGEVPGDHDVRFDSASESLQFAHSVTTRDVFARGAVRAAQWVVARRNGFYSMQDVLFGV